MNVTTSCFFSIRCHIHGMPPSRIDACPDVTFDQAHLTRECAKLSGLTPAALARQRAV